MEDKILNGKEVANHVKESLKTEVDRLKEKGIIPKLAVIMVGDNPASKVYVKNKSKACEKVGVEFEEFLLPETVEEKDVFDLIERLNQNPCIHGILVQSPLPSHLNQNAVFQKIKVEKDVDGFHAVNVGNLWLGNDGFVSCTPYGVMKILEHYHINVEGKNVVILGRSNIVGKPMARCMLSENATVTVCHSKTKDLKNVTRNADILICAMGKPKFITKEYLKEGAIVIDVGINRQEGTNKICGDVDFEDVISKVSKITPVPGGVGPMTIAMLLYNVVKATKQQNEI